MIKLRNTPEWYARNTESAPVTHTAQLIPNTTDALITCSMVGYKFRLASTPQPVAVRCLSCGEVV